MPYLYTYYLYCNDCECARYTDYREGEPTVCPYNGAHTDIQDIAVSSRMGLSEVSITGQDPIDNSLPSAHSPPKGADIDVFTHNFCDRTTWFNESESVEGETLTDSGDGLTFNSAHTYWINLVSGLVTNEIAIRDTYTPTVYDGGTPLTMRSPFSDSGGDYTIDWDSGDVTFFSDKSGHTITADYHYENGSAWVITPPAGKLYCIDGGKFLCTTDDFSMTTSFHYEVLAGEYVVGQSWYDTMHQLVDTAAGCAGELVGPIGTGARALPSHTFRGMAIEYETTRDLYNSLGLSLRIRLGDDIPFGGTRCVLRLKGRVYDEP